MCSGAAGRLHDVLTDLRATGDGQEIPEEYTAVLLKALLVHGAGWGEAQAAIARAIPKAEKDAEKALVARMMGYGAADVLV